MDKDKSTPEAANKGFQPFSQSEVAYVPYQNSITGCGGCRFFIADYYDDGIPDQDACQIVESGPDPIQPTGLCNQFAPRRSAQESEVVEAIPVTIVEGADVVIPASVISEDKSLLGRLKALFSPQKPATNQGFKLLDDNPDYDWIAWYTNNFEDREKQIIAAKAIAQHIADVESGIEPYPELQYFHIPSSKHGQATKLLQLDHFAIALGTFDDTPVADAFKAHYASNAHKLGVSHGFLYDPSLLVNGVYHAVKTFEISPLPMALAANQFTSFERTKAMPITDAQKQHVIAAIGSELGNQIVTAAESYSKELEENGTNFKAQTVTPDLEARESITALEVQVKALTEAVVKMAEAVGTEAAPEATPVTEPAAPTEPASDDDAASMLETLAGSMKTMQQQLLAIQAAGVPASQAPETALSNDSEMVKFLAEQAAKAGQPLPLLHQYGTPLNGQS